MLAPAAPPSFIAKHAVLSGAALQVAPGCFRAPGQRELVLGRVVSLELLTQRADGSLEVTLGALRNRRRVALTQPRTRAQSVWEQPVFDTILDLTVLPWSGAEASAHVRRRSARTPVLRTLTLWSLASQPLYGRDLLLVSAGGSRRSTALVQSSLSNAPLMRSLGSLERPCFRRGLAPFCDAAAAGASER